MNELSRQPSKGEKNLAAKNLVRKTFNESAWVFSFETSHAYLHNAEHNVRLALYDPQTQTLRCNSDFAKYVTVIYETNIFSFENLDIKNIFLEIFGVEAEHVYMMPQVQFFLFQFLH